MYKMLAESRIIIRNYRKSSYDSTSYFSVIMLIGQVDNLHCANIVIKYYSVVVKCSYSIIDVLVQTS